MIDRYAIQCRKNLNWLKSDWLSMCLKYEMPCRRTAAFWVPWYIWAICWRGHFYLPPPPWNPPELYRILLPDILDFFLIYQLFLRVFWNLKFFVKKFFNFFQTTLKILHYRIKSAWKFLFGVVDPHPKKNLFPHVCPEQ